MYSVNFLHFRKYLHERFDNFQTEDHGDNNISWCKIVDQYFLGFWLGIGLIQIHWFGWSLFWTKNVSPFFVNLCTKKSKQMRCHVDCLSIQAVRICFSSRPCCAVIVRLIWNKISLARWNFLKNSSGHSFKKEKILKLKSFYNKSTQTRG